MTFSDAALSSSELSTVSAALGAITANADAQGFGWSESDVTAYAESTDSGNAWRRILIRIILWLLQQLAENPQ